MSKEFEAYWARYEEENCPIDNTEYGAAEKAWDAATKIEREACAKLCESDYFDGLCGHQCAEGIRKRGAK